MAFSDGSWSSSTSSSTSSNGGRSTSSSRSRNSAREAAGKSSQKRAQPAAKPQGVAKAKPKSKQRGKRKTAAEKAAMEVRITHITTFFGSRSAELKFSTDLKAFMLSILPAISPALPLPPRQSQNWQVAMLPTQSYMQRRAQSNLAANSCPFSRFSTRRVTRRGEFRARRCRRRLPLEFRLQDVKRTLKGLYLFSIFLCNGSNFLRFHSYIEWSLLNLLARPYVLVLSQCLF